MDTAGLVPIKVKGKGALSAPGWSCSPAMLWESGSFETQAYRFLTQDIYEDGILRICIEDFTRRRRNATVSTLRTFTWLIRWAPCSVDLI